MIDAEFRPGRQNDVAGRRCLKKVERNPQRSGDQDDEKNRYAYAVALGQQRKIVGIHPIFPIGLDAVGLAAALSASRRIIPSRVIELPVRMASRLPTRHPLAAADQAPPTPRGWGAAGLRRLISHLSPLLPERFDMMNYQNIDTGCIDDESMPWMPFAPYSDKVMVKYFKADPVRGEVISLLKAPPGTTLLKHHHTGTVIVYTIQGSWKYLEHDWVARPKSVVFETASTEHTPLAMPESNEDIITLNITVGD